MRVVRFADGRSESPLESISRVAFHELGLPAPEPQVEVWLGDELLARVDFFWRHRKTVGEADGKAGRLPCLGYNGLAEVTVEVLVPAEPAAASAD